MFANYRARSLEYLSCSQCTFEQSSRVSDPDDLSRFSTSVFLIDLHARRQFHSSSVNRQVCDVPVACFLLEMLSSVVLRRVLSATRLWPFPSVADVQEYSDPEIPGQSKNE